MPAAPELSALYIPPRTALKPRTEKSVLEKWVVEPRESPPHPCFDAATGVYTVGVDGLYSVIVQVIPTGGGANAADAGRRRKKVDYAVRLRDAAEGAVGDGDGVESEFLDVGQASFGEVLHLRARSSVSVYMMPTCDGTDSIRLKVDIVQRKRKRDPEPELSKKELKQRRKKAKRRVTDPAKAGFAATGASVTEQKPALDEGEKEGEEDSEESSSSQWSNAFSSDWSGDEFPHSKKGVGRLAKRFKHATDHSPVHTT